ncbi:hypothetical protein K7X08_030487 [Anisodus acutangulus]|uniref:Zinc finger C3HC4 RING-type domain-containing protein n=1 Tax=Anisodus acutangulus TaxID=402998 RepID=A0A9Q1L7G1_9SOLA|nr:hypothetical protein K7X08_030487 [Anisodus acutangulus]
MPTEESRRYIQVSLDVEYAKCCICLNIWHDVVTAAPCLHNFCNGCFSEWLRRSQVNNSLKRLSEDTKLLDSCASIKSPLTPNLECNNTVWDVIEHFVLLIGILRESMGAIHIHSAFVKRSSLLQSVQILEFPPWHMRRIILNKISLKDALDRWEGRCKMW